MIVGRARVDVTISAGDVAECDRFEPERFEAIERDADMALGRGLPVGQAEFSQRTSSGGSDFRFLGATSKSLKDAPSM